MTLEELQALPLGEYDRIQKEAAKIRKDIQTADELLKDAQDRYRKVKLKARSKKQAKEMLETYADLDGYDSTDDISEAYGYGTITAREMERLLALWDAREKAKTTGGQYTDPVLEMLEEARWMLGGKYHDILHQADELRYQMEAEQKGAHTCHP